VRAIVVEIRANLFLHAWLVSRDLARRRTAHRDLALAGPEILHGEAGDVCGNRLDALRPSLAKHRCGRRSDGEGNVEQLLLAESRRHDDSLQRKRFEIEVDGGVTLARVNRDACRTTIPDERRDDSVQPRRQRSDRVAPSSAGAGAARDAGCGAGRTDADAFARIA
jgi:hypothetical protein